MKTLRTEIEKWINRLSQKPSYAVTLTMKQTGNDTLNARLRCQKNMRHYLNVLNQSAFGNAYLRYQKKMEVVPILEVSPWMRLHYHLLIVKPDRFSDDEFVKLLEMTWHKTHLANNENTFEKVYSQGWANYITKNLDLNSEVDFENMHIVC